MVESKVIKTVCLTVLLVVSGHALAKVNINTATVEELSRLKGIGEEKAKAIVAYRDEHGAFAKVEDIVLVKGIGEKILKDLQEDLSIEGETSFEDVKNLK